MPKKKADPITTSEPEFSNQALNESSAIESASPNEAMPPTETVPTVKDDLQFLPDEASLAELTTPKPRRKSSPKATTPIPVKKGADVESSSDDEPEILEGDAEYGYAHLLSEISSSVTDKKDADSKSSPLFLDEESEHKESGSGQSVSFIKKDLLEEKADGSPPPGKAISPVSPRFLRARQSDSILTINFRDEIISDAEREATLWHEVQRAYRTRRILSGPLDSVEQTESGLTLAIVNYNGFRVVIPLSEMVLDYPTTDDSALTYSEFMELQTRRMFRRLGSEIDFVVKGIDKRSRSVVASRKEAMYRKRQIFYVDQDENGQPLIYEGRIVQARIVDVSVKVIRVEVFGVECPIHGKDITSAWFIDANEEYRVGDTVLVRVNYIECPSIEKLKIAADIRSLQPNNGSDLSRCTVQGRYVGRVTDVRSGNYYLRLNNGINAIAHSNYDLRTPGKNDDVSFVVTRLDGDRNCAIGIITRVIRQNL